MCEKNIGGYGLSAMTVNLHTHTARCHHASGTEREYVEKAIEAGIRVLGFSDHAPYPFPDGYQSGFRMNVTETEAYVETLKALREEYRKDITIYIGYEAEYYPRHFDAMLKNLFRYDCDYLILGQHFLGNEYDGAPYSGRGSSAESDYSSYVDQTIAAMETGVFSYFAHPDIFRFTGEDEAYLRQTERLCLAAKRMAIPLEINLLGVAEKRSYPRELFWQTAAKIGCDVVYGSDAHSPGAVLRPEAIKKANEMAKRLGLRVLSAPPIRNPKAVVKSF